MPKKQLTFKTTIKILKSLDKSIQISAVRLSYDKNSGKQCRIIKDKLSEARVQSEVIDFTFRSSLRL